MPLISQALSASTLLFLSFINPISFFISLKSSIIFKFIYANAINGNIPNIKTNIKNKTNEINDKIAYILPSLFLNNAINEEIATAIAKLNNIISIT